MSRWCYLRIVNSTAPEPSQDIVPVVRPANMALSLSTTNDLRGLDNATSIIAGYLLSVYTMFFLSKQLMARIWTPSMLDQR